MNTATTKQLSEHQIQQAKAVSIVNLAEAHTVLRRESVGGEWSGPCPKPTCDARTDGLRVHEDGWFFCRKCHTKRGDAIEFMRWLHGYGFMQAVAALTNGDIPTYKPVVRQPTKSPVTQTEEWQRKAENILRRAQTRLWESEGTLGQEYLLGRGLEPHTWQQYGLGYRADIPLPGTWDSKSGRFVYPPQPAIAIPWLAGQRLNANRYRFLKLHVYIDTEGRKREVKQTAEAGSMFSGRLFGGQALSGGLERLRWLLICEGEINAMSCCQAAHETNLDVLSIGSESAVLPAKAIEFAKRYRGVLVWADKEVVALRLMEALPGAVGIKSPHGNDANDLLRKGLLCGFLAAKRERAAQSDNDREDLLWALYDAAMLPTGIDTETAIVLQRIATQLGKNVSIHEAEPGRWVTSWLISDCQ